MVGPALSVPLCIGSRPSAASAAPASDGCSATGGPLPCGNDAYTRNICPSRCPREPLALVARWLDAGHARSGAAQSECHGAGHGRPARSALCASGAVQGHPAAARLPDLFQQLRVAQGHGAGGQSARRGGDALGSVAPAGANRRAGGARRCRRERRLFRSRAWQSRIGAWASRQSSTVPSRAALAAAVERTARRFGVPSPLQSADDAPDPGIAIPRPPHWGGYHLWAEAVEIWVEGAGRLHDRARWTRKLEPASSGFSADGWSVTRLQP